LWIPGLHQDAHPRMCNCTSGNDDDKVSVAQAGCFL
jgi:hypothetical protein